MMTLSHSGQLSAQDIDTLVMPGEVIAGHADLEAECANCHKMFDKSAQRGLCLDCHEEVATDISAAMGFHGQFSDARDDRCSSCHTDHEGREARIVLLDEANFDHQFTDFELRDSHLEADCSDCHAADDKHREAPHACVDCHREDDAHDEILGTECGDCHRPTEWTDARADFDHDETGYPLLGKHRDPACVDCHADQTFQDTPTTCIGCHEDDDRHEGRNGRECDSCHNPSGWTDTSFDHTRDTDFELVGNHARLTCTDCHSSDPYADELESTCVSCHLDDDHHEGHNGEECNSCHNDTDWTEPTFDHDIDTEYALNGAHREVVCNDCHVEPVFEVELATTCESCHLEDEPHDQSLGSRCESCHTEVNWEDPVFFDHDLTAFPLLGKHTERECTDCHETQVFGGTESQCINCHAEDDSHEGYFRDRCEDCHNPVAWEIWIFDHDTQTRFPLDGAHTDVACGDCHRSSLDRMRNNETDCRSCHRANDVHDGEFGGDCGRCHSVESFLDVRSIQ